MMINLITDRSFIENKFHKQNEPFNPYARMAYHGYNFPEDSGLSDEEIRAGLRELSPSLEKLPHPVAKAKAVEYVLDHTRIDTNEHDMFVGLYSLNRLANEFTCQKWEKELFTQIIPQTGELNRELNESNAVAIWPDFDHVVPHWDSILDLGFCGLKQRVISYRNYHQERGTLTEEKAALFTGMEILYSAIERLIDRLYRHALSQTHARAKGYADCLKTIKEGAPQTTYEAMQTMYLYFLISECFDSYQVRSLGHGLDATLYPYYLADLQSGRATREELKEQLAYFFMQWSAIGNYWGQPFYMGGTNADGSSKYNELSRDILDVYDELDIYNPKIQLKVNYNTPDWLYQKVFDMIRRGHNCFVFCCEPGMSKAVMSYGATKEEARTMDIRGCYETGIRADEVSSVTGYVNGVKAVEYVFSNGFERRLNKQFGLKTGEIEELTSFEDFYHAVLMQWANLVEYTVQAANAYEQYFAEINPSLTYTATMERSLKRGVDGYQCGVKFNNSAILNCSFASLVDSVMAVKELVYEQKLVTLAQMKVALEHNWQGYEWLRAKALTSKRKYGNGDKETDEYAKAMAAYFTKIVCNRPNARGGVYKSLLHSAMEFVWQGERAPASPDGRRAGDELSKNASPSVGMDRKGVTALINSALALQPSSYSESFCLDVMLHPSAVSGEEGLAVMKALLTAYMNGDGMSMQCNVFQTETLKDAQKHPEKYRNLQVRVCGWNVLWNNLSKKEQNAYILRAGNHE